MSAADSSASPSAGIVAGVAAGGVPGTEFSAWDVRTGTARSTVFRDASADDVDAAVTAAARAFRGAQLEDSALSPATLVSAIADALDARVDELIAIAALETGLDPDARLRGEVARTSGQLRMLGAEAERRSGAFLAEDPPVPEQSLPGLVLGQVPIGPVGVFGASNFPFAFGVLGGDTAAALAAGCPVVAKGHPAHPETSELLGAIATAAVSELGLDPGWFSLLQGRGESVGSAITVSPELEAVAFTGSTRGGLALSDLAARRPRPIPVFAELGGINALYLLPAAAASPNESFISGLAGSLTNNGGQLCTKPGLLVLVGDEAGLSVVTELARVLGGIETAPLLTGGTRAAFATGVDRLAAIEGVSILHAARGEVPAGAPVPSAVAVLSSAALRADPSAADEIFGPAVVVIVCADADDLLSVVEVIPPGLTGTIHAADGDHALLPPLMRRLRLRVGRVLFGGYPTGVRVGSATTHGGPFPATTTPWTTSVGARAIDRFVRPVTYQNLPDSLRATALAWS
jgi:alpha-ketoglutaric semialdehyde dehydrogenase